jgi:hypothetical protein
MMHSRFRISLDGIPTRHIDGPTIGFQHLVTVTNTDSAVRRMLLSALPQSSISSNPSQLSSSVPCIVVPHPDAADDQMSVDRPNVDSPQTEMLSLMEVGDCVCFLAHFFILTMCLGPFYRSLS